MSLRRKVLCAVPLLLGCWTLKPGDAIPDGGAVDVSRTDATDASLDVTDVVRLDATDASLDVTDVARLDATDASLDVTDVVRLDAPDVVQLDVTDVVRLDVTDVVQPDVTDVARLDAPDASLDVTDVVRLDAPDVPPPTDVPRDVPVIVPTGLRLIAPPGLSTLTSPRPTLRWSADVSGVEAVVCTDRSCSTAPRYVAEVTGRSHAVAVDLPAGMYFWHLRRRTAERVSAVWQMRIAGHVANRPSNAFGVSHRDMDNDGYSDIAIGAPGPRNSATPGAVYVFRGGPSGPSTPLPFPAPAGANFGWDLAWGDFNGDNRADLAVTSYDSVRQTNGFVTILQSTGSSLAPRATTLNCGGCGSNTFAARVATGDTDGDGRDDIFVPSPQTSARVLVWRGMSFGPGGAAAVDIPNPNPLESAFGTALSVVGDIDGDGYGDLIVGSPCDAGSGMTCGGSAGRVHIFFGGIDWGGRGPIAVTVNGPPMGFLGVEVSALGDINGDGYADFAASGINGASQLTAGAVRIYLGGTRDTFGPSRAADATLTAPVGAQMFGAAIAGADLDSDGLTDVLVGAPGPETTFILRGSVTGHPRGAAGPTYTTGDTYTPTGTTALVGHRIAAVGDTNGDGRGDWVVTAPAIAAGALNHTDTAYLWFGGGTEYNRAPDHLLRSGTNGAWFGRGLAP